MDERLFEKYCRDALSERERRRLAERLADPRISRRFAAFVQEWSLIAEIARGRFRSGRGPR